MHQVAAAHKKKLKPLRTNDSPDGFHVPAFHFLSTVPTDSLIQNFHEQMEDKTSDVHEDKEQMKRSWMQRSFSQTNRRNLHFRKTDKGVDEKRGFYINPTGLFRSMWDMFVVVLVLYNAFFLPYFICFPVEEFTEQKNMDFFVDIIFFVDIVLNFLTAIEQKEPDAPLIVDRRSIVKNYLKGFFVLDLLGVVPFEWLGKQLGQVDASDHSSTFAILQGLKCFRLFRLSHLLKFLDKFHFFGHFMRLLRLLLLFLIVTHMYACLWFLIGNAQGSEGWLTAASINVTATHHRTLYVTSAHWVVVTFLTVGYGDIPILSDIDRAYSMLTMLTGAVLYAVIFGSVNSMVTGLNASNHYAAQIKALTRMLADMSVPQDIQERSRSYYAYKLKQDGFLHGDVLQNLPDALRDEIAWHLAEDMLKKNVLFLDCPQEVVRAFSSRLEGMRVLPGDEVIKEGDPAEAFFVVRTGMLQVVSRKHGMLTVLEAGSYFGEIALLAAKNRRTATVTALGNCDLYEMRANYLYDFFQRFPSYEALVVELAEARWEQTRKHIDSVLTETIFRKAVMKGHVNLAMTERATLLRSQRKKQTNNHHQGVSKSKEISGRKFSSPAGSADSFVPEIGTAEHDELLALYKIAQEPLEEQNIGFGDSSSDNIVPEPPMSPRMRISGQIDKQDITPLAGLPEEMEEEEEEKVEILSAVE